jgi:hypothetical protein
MPTDTAGQKYMNSGWPLGPKFRRKIGSRHTSVVKISVRQYDDSEQTTVSRRDGRQRIRQTGLLGSDRRNRRWEFLTGVALGLFGVTFFAYEFDIFSDSGGVVFVPFHAAIVGGSPRSGRDTVEVDSSSRVAGGMGDGYLASGTH